ncbi:sigma-54-dependent transcriptional regulator [Caldimonas brevitalea]|uniref:sigma-54-dependent transcriptional regulator n=1 Tax=Caldimonas brevitalea TaxID=413882 RepID=UPI0009FB9058|nr:sigma-54 dependent transcriptional regulator [Caldimonas brevitalea]
MPHVLIVDDSPDELGWMSEVVQAQGCTVATADSLRAARVQLVRQQPEVLLTDIQLPDGNGLQLVHDLEAPAQTEVVAITGHASVDSVVEALRLGATDYLVKPVDIERLRAILKRQPEAAELRHEIGELRGELRKAGRFGALLGGSPAMQSLYDKLARVAPTSATVLLIGESGTGKELAARTIHDLSRRRKLPFLAVNCGAISPQLIESELFGHEKGSFTGADRQHVGFFERANGGTLLLDEVTEMPLELQVKLLRVLETGSFVRVGTTQPISTDVRMVAATNRLPEKAVAEGRFREDLYHRLNVFPVHLPPLRERGNDIEMLAQYFLDELNRQEGTHKTFSPQAIAKLYERSWSGNVRELKNYVQRAFILSDDVVEAAESTETQPEEGPSDVISIRIGTPLDEVERRVTMATLERCGQVKRKTAEVLGISLKTLYNRLEVYSMKDQARDGGDVRRQAGKDRPTDNSTSPPKH